MKNISYNKIYNKLTGELLNCAFQGNPDKNVVLSPLSLLILLIVLAETSSGKTQKEVRHALCSGRNYPKFRQYIKKLQKHLKEDSALKIANCVMVQEKIRGSINPGYEEQLKQDFEGELFISDHLIGDINNWVKEKTNGLIDQIADDSVKDMLFVLLNAVAFEAQWEDEYKENDIINKDFHNSDGTVSRVKMLASSEYGYIENSLFTGIVKPYKDADYSYMALLPKDPACKLSEQSYKDIDITNIYFSRKSVEVSVTMPEYKTSYALDLTDLCRKLGITTAFTSEAQFDALSDERLMLEGIGQKAYIQVDRKGTKAAAATYAFGFSGFIDFDIKVVYLNRPFLYAIVHNETGFPIFIGGVNHLEENRDGDGMLLSEKE